MPGKVLLEDTFLDSPREQGEADRPRASRGLLLVAVFVSMPLCVMVPLSVRVPPSVMVSLPVSAVVCVIECAPVSVTVLVSLTVSVMVLLSGIAYVLAMVCVCVHVIPALAEIVAARVSLKASVPLMVLDSV